MTAPKLPAEPTPQKFVITFPNGEKLCDCDRLSEKCKLGRVRPLHTAEFGRCLLPAEPNRWLSYQTCGNDVLVVPAHDYDALRSQLTSALALAAEREVEIAEFNRLLSQEHYIATQHYERAKAANARAEAMAANDRRYRWLRLDSRPCDCVEFVEVNNGCGAFGAATEDELDAAIDAAAKP